MAGVASGTGRLSAVPGRERPATTRAGMLADGGGHTGGVKGHSVRDLAGVNWPPAALSGGSGVTGLDALEGLPRAVR